MKNNNTGLYVVIIVLLIFFSPFIILIVDDLILYSEDNISTYEDDYARISDIDYKAVVLDEANSGGNILVTERITYDVHAASENNLFWELWRDLPEKDVDGLPVRYEVQSVKQILEDGSEIVYTESPKLYWYDEDYTDEPYGPGKWYHSEGPYDDYNNFECVLFYVDGLYREKVTFEVQYIMKNASFRYSDVSQLYLTLYSDQSINYLNSYKAQILVSDKDMPATRNYYASTYGTKDYKFEFTESDTLNPGYHTFVIDLDKDELDFDYDTEYLEFSFISFNEDKHIFTEHAPDNYYSNSPYLEELKAEIEDFYNIPIVRKNKKIKILLYSVVGSIFVIIYVYLFKKNIEKDNTFYKPHTKIEYFRDIPSDLDPHFASFLVFSKGKKKDRLSETLSSLMLSLARKEYIELIKIDESEDWEFRNIKIKVLYTAPIIQKTNPSIPIRDLKTIEKSNETLVNNLVNQKNQTINSNANSGLMVKSNVISNTPIQVDNKRVEYNSLLSVSSKANPTLISKPAPAIHLEMPPAYYQKYNIRGKKLEKLTPNEEVYFNLILRYAKQTFHEITLKKFQDKIYVDNDNVDSVVTAIEDSVGKIGFSNQYFTTPKYNLINDKISGKVTFFYVVACLLLIFGNYMSMVSGLGIAYGGFIIIGLVCIVCGSYLNSISKNYMLLTQYGENEREKWTALYNFLNSETLMNERTVIDVKLWEKYLVYATAFGISEKVCKALKIRCPETTISNSAILSNNYYRTSSFRSYSRSIGRYARSSSNTSRSSRYNGGYYGGGGSYGGGGRGGGGGGGGH